MVSKFFLALDYRTPEEILARGRHAINFLSENFGVGGRLGVKINGDMLVDADRRYQEFAACGYEIFADTKICHRYSTGENMMDRLREKIGFRYFTLSSALLDRDDLRKYSSYAGEKGLHAIAFTAPTYADESISRIFNRRNLDEVSFELGLAAYDGGCHAVVLEAQTLRNENIRGLPLKKLVTGIRLSASEKGEQKRISLIDDVRKMKDFIDYVVVSSIYLKNDKALERYFSCLL